MIRSAFLAVALLAASAASASAAEYVIAAVKVIYPGQEIAEDMVKRVALKRPMANAHRAIKSMDDIVGRTAVRTILPNRLIFASSFVESPVVEAGQRVTVVYRAGPLQMSMAGTALEDGLAEEQIRIRNTESGRTFIGRVDRSGTIMVDGT